MLTKEILNKIFNTFGNNTTVREMVFIHTEKKDFEAEIKLMKAHPEYAFYFTSEEA